MSSHPEEIHQSLQGHWVKGIFRYYDDREKPSWNDFLNEYRHLLGPKKTARKLPPITAMQLSDRATWRGGTHGLDGWRYKELRLLPQGVWEMLASFLNALEQHDEPTWPPALCWGSIPLLPKEGPPSPLNLRPLTILSVLYRIWAGIRASQLGQWQETWIHHSHTWRKSWP